MRMPGCSKLTSTLSACHASGTHFIPLETETLSNLSATVEAMFEQLATVLVAKPSSFIFGKIEVQHAACGFSPSVDDIIYCLTIYFAFPFYINYSYFLHFFIPIFLTFFMIFSATLPVSFYVSLVYLHSLQCHFHFLLLKLWYI